jgi:hypothetical protein
MSDDVGQQQARNRETWARLQEAGVRVGDPLTVDAYFVAPDESASDSLAADLRTDGWFAETHSHREGYLRRRTIWSLQASRRLPAVDLPALDDMVELLVRRAGENGAEFDGWGALATSDGP